MGLDFKFRSSKFKGATKLYFKDYSYLVIIVGETRRRRDIKIPLCLSAPVWKSLAIVDSRKSAIFTFQFVKPILQTNTHLIQ